LEKNLTQVDGISVSFANSMNKRPLIVTIISLLFLIVGLGSIGKSVWFVIGANHGVSRQKELLDGAIVCVSGLIALVSGIFMWRGANWARWLCIVWLALHVIIGALHSTSELIAHTVLLLVIGTLLLLPGVSRYFVST